MADPPSILSPPLNNNDQLPSQSPITTISAAIPILLLVATWYFSVKRSKSRAPPPPGPRGLPIVGYIPFLAGDNPLHRKFADLAAQYGPIFKIWFANQMFVVVSSPDLTKEVLLRGGQNEPIFSTRGFPAAAGVCTYGGTDVLSLPMGHDWKSMRKLLVRETLSNPALDLCFPLRRRELVRSLREVISNELVGKPVGVYELTYKIVSNATLGMLWGGEGDQFCFEELRVVSQEVMEINSRPNVSDMFPLLARFDLQGILKEATAVAQRLDWVFSSVIERRLEGGKLKKQGEGEKRLKDMLQILLEIREDSENAGSSSLASMTHLKDIATGGTENISNVIEWALSELLMNDRVMKNVKRELDEIVGLDSLVEDHHLKNLNYLEAVVKETCRLHLNLFPRLSTAPSTLGGYAIPKGSMVIINAWAIHRDPQFWDEPSEFRPERFLNKDDDKRPFDLMGNNSNFQFIPFGSGQRICAGANLAGKLLRYVLASLLHSFDWKQPDGAEKIEFSDYYKIFIKKKKPLMAVPTLRLSSQDLFA
ncbi:unnamed protein product [Linum tenue]|uniref:Cytochrome P450 n=1 Tax=Linum tenue TaxID=586396 RepID=A0AAV0JWK3_9ROSI|nr:unnamed protein product [Linum tenue]